MEDILKPPFSTELSDLQINKQTIDLLIANVIPTTKYFESRFDHMQYQIDEIRHQLSDFKGDVDRRFDAMQADTERRFNKVDSRFDKVITAIERLGDKLDSSYSKLNEKTEYSPNPGKKFRKAIYFKGKQKT